MFSWGSLWYTAYACHHHYNYHHHRVKICLKGLSSACSGLLIIVENTNQPTTLQPVISNDVVLVKGKNKGTERKQVPSMI